jgi:2-hydroxycyclohexanecarboxyl-CoA dehydrogenase
VDTGLAGKVVIVTGATANIGRGIALAFAGEGARVVVVGRDVEAGERVCALARERGAPEVLARPTDVTVESDVDGLVTDVMARFGRIDVLVNNVGGNTAIGPFASSSPRQWRADLDANLFSTLLCTHAVLPHMLACGSGRIINIGSMAAIVGDRLLAVYSAAKGGVHAFTRVLALEVGKAGITVNAIAPYRTRSEDPDEEFSSGSRYHPESGLIAKALRERPEELRTMLRETALRRQQAWPEEIGAAAVYLASAQAAFVTGQIHQVDGGIVLM